MKEDSKKKQPLKKPPEADMQPSRRELPALYVPLQPEHWGDTPPRTVHEAIDRLAASLSSGGVSPIPHVSHKHRRG